MPLIFAVVSLFYKENKLTTVTFQLLILLSHWPKEAYARLRSEAYGTPSFLTKSKNIYTVAT